jgi:hypothetical protein
MNPGIFVAIAAASRKKTCDRILKAFREAGATRAQQAQQLGDQFTGRREKSEWAQLIEAGVIRQPQPGRYYLDEPALTDYNASRRRVAAMVVTGVAVLGLLIILFTNLQR